MSTNSGESTLASLFLEDAAGLSNAVAAALGSGSEAGGAKHSLLRVVGGLPSGGLADAIARELHGLLDIGVSDVLAAAWNQARELRDALEQTREKADQTMLVPLVDHTVKSDHRPYIDILQNDVPIARLEFSVHLELELDGILLRVRGGQIDSILTGRLKAKGTVKLGDFVLVERSLRPVVIPGTLNLRHAA